MRQLRKFPFLGVMNLTEDQVKLLKLNTSSKWKAFAFEWHSFLFVFVGWKTSTKGDLDA